MSKSGSNGQNEENKPDVSHHRHQKETPTHIDKADVSIETGECLLTHLVKNIIAFKELAESNTCNHKELMAKTNSKSSVVQFNGIGFWLETFFKVSKNNKKLNLFFKVRCNRLVTK